MTPRFIDKDEVIETEGVRHVAKPGDLLLTRPMMKPRLIRSPSPALVAFARGASRNLPQVQALGREEELAINREHFRDDIASLQKLIGRDLGFWLE